jgi:hypothetical protein
MPSRARVSGVADFGRGLRVEGQFGVLPEGRPAVSSSLGTHAVREDRWMVLAVDPESCWGTLDGFWVLPALASFLVEMLDRPLVMLPAVGWIRYDDVPGSGYDQMIGREKPDRRVRRRIARLIDHFAALNAKINIATPCRGFVGGEEAPVDEIWPEATAALADGVKAGVIEPVCYAYLLLDTDALARGEIEPREFASTPKDEAARKLDVAMQWLSSRVGARPSTFVAPTWGYGEGLLAALAERDLPAWLPPEPGPLVADGNLRETLFSTMEGLFRLDYRPLAKLAEAGYPPMVVAHGGLLDQRMRRIRRLRELPTAARLGVRRDLFRVPAIEGVRWIGAGEMMGRLRAHDRIEFDGDRVRMPEGAEAVLVDRFGRRPLSG